MLSVRVTADALVVLEGAAYLAQAAGLRLRQSVF